MPDPGSAPGPCGGQHDQPAGQRQDNGQDTEGREEPAGLPARLGSLCRVGHLGGCGRGVVGLLLGRLPPLGGVRGDLLFRVGRTQEARQEFERAAGLTRNARERELLLQRARACETLPEHPSV